MGCSEVDTYSDTIDKCDDGTEAMYLVDESFKKILVSAIDSQKNQAGCMARIESVLSPVEDCLTYDIAHFYYAEIVNTQFNPEWVYLSSVVPSNVTGLHMLEMQFTLNISGIQAVHAKSERFLPEGSCFIDGFEIFDDHSDLVFSVAKEATW